MKKILIITILITLPLLLQAALTGDGTYSSPWSGTIEGDATWSGTKYINGDIIIDNEKLTISPGAIIIFLTETANLIVTSTGQLEADGTPGSMIRFTSDDDNDGIYGESGETWGHISFQSMGSAGASLIDNCIIEYGDVRSAGSTDNPYRYGGAIHAAFSNLIISNCILQNNQAKWGGALFVNKSFSPTIMNCRIYNNKSNRGGGGFYFWDGSGSIVENCLFDSNQCLETSNNIYTGGGLTTQTGCSVKVINCTFVNNTTTRPTGASIELYGSVGDIVINTICWGSGTHIYRTGSNTIQYTAVQGTAPTGTGNFLLNSSNTGLNPMGPYFNNPGSSDWSIKVVSPCRDAGTTPSPTVPNDYAGNSRILPYDIGAFEVQYNGWKTTATNSTWADDANWDLGEPNSSENVVIRSGASSYPTNSDTQDFTIGSDYGLVLDPGAKATFNTLTKSGDLKLMSNSSATSSLITNNSVSSIVELYLTGGGGSNYRWHYISSPVSALPVNTFILKSEMDFAQFFESRPITNPLQGWVAYDGWYYSGGYYLTGSPYVISGTNMNVGQGYNYYYASDYKFTFSGSTNVSTVSPTITFGGNATLHGFNLLGNPFPSGLDWATIIGDAGFPSSTSKGLYFTRNNSQCSYIGGVGYPDVYVTGIIPPMQGFFIHTSNTSTTLPLLSSARAHNIPARYKGGGEIIPLVRLQLDSDTLMDNTVVRFDSKASPVLDNDFDAIRMFLSGSVQYIYSTDGSAKYAINGQPFPETTLQIPLAVNVLSSGNHSITASQLQGLESYNIGLKDNITGFTADLKSNPTILFSSDAGIFTGRFVLVVSGSTTAIPEYPNISEKTFNIYYYQNMLNIQTLGDEWDGRQGSVNIYNLTGKITASEQNVELYRSSLIQIPANLTKGIYVVEIKSGIQRYAGKVVIR
jgi:hypothetical protein